MKIAVVGGGPCGLFMCDKLSKEHDVTLYERESVLGDAQGPADEFIFGTRAARHVR